jgi:pSer/pThr/pTyr-binding forkhead associated (FHA) protein
MILKGARELIVEDLNSTNGVLVNGRKVTRHLLKDGDVLTVGEIQFRCVLKPKPVEGRRSWP